MEATDLTELTAAVLATFGIVCGMGATCWKGYQAGRSILPPVVIWLVNVPMSMAVALRAITFLLNGDYWFFIAVDCAAFIFLAGTIGQHFGLFIRKQR